MPNPGSLGFKLRPAVDSDLTFVKASWLRSYRAHWVSSKHITNTVFFKGHGDLIARIMPRGKIIVAESTTVEDELAGWICVDEIDCEFVLHYIYVKHIYRRVGLARWMLEAAGCKNGKFTATHITKFNKMRRNGTMTIGPFYRVENNPYLLYSY